MRASIIKQFTAVINKPTSSYHEMFILLLLEVVYCKAALKKLWNEMSATREEACVRGSRDPSISYTA